MFWLCFSVKTANRKFLYRIIYAYFQASPILCHCCPRDHWRESCRAHEQNWPLLQFLSLPIFVVTIVTNAALESQHSNIRSIAYKRTKRYFEQNILWKCTQYTHKIASKWHHYISLSFMKIHWPQKTPFTFPDTIDQYLSRHFDTKDRLRRTVSHYLL